MEKVPGDPEREKNSTVGKSTDLEQGETHKSLESTEELEGHSTFLASLVSLLKAIIGIGMLSLPVAFYELGIISGTLILISSGLLSAFGLTLLSHCASIVGRNASIYTVSQRTYPALYVFFDFVILMKCVIVACVFQSAIGGFMAKVVENFAGENSLFSDRKTWIIISLIVTSPLSYFKKLDSLKLSSFLGMIAVVYLFLMASVRVLYADIKVIQWLPKMQTKSLSNIGTFIFAFTCHQNMFPIQNEAKDNRPVRMRLLVYASIAISFVIYAGFGIMETLIIGDKLQKDIFTSYGKSEWYFILARILFCFLLAFSYPLQIFPGRASFERILPFKKEFKETWKWTIHLSLTTVLLLSTLIVSLRFENIAAMTKMSGSVPSVLICYIVPSVFYWKIAEKDGYTLTRIMAGLLFIFGCICIPFLLYTNSL